MRTHETHTHTDVYGWLIVQLVRMRAGDRALQVKGQLHPRRLTSSNKIWPPGIWSVCVSVCVCVCVCVWLRGCITDLKIFMILLFISQWKSLFFLFLFYLNHKDVKQELKRKVKAERNRPKENNPEHLRLFDSCSSSSFHPLLFLHFPPSLIALQLYRLALTLTLTHTKGNAYWSVHTHTHTRALQRLNLHQMFVTVKTSWRHRVNTIGFLICDDSQQRFCLNYCR